MKKLKIELIKDIPFDQNAYIFHDDNEAFIIDPGYQYKLIDNFLEKNNLKLIKILLTHFHYDHSYSAKWLADKYKINIMIHKKDSDLLANNTLGKDMGFENVTIPKNYHEIFDKSFKLLKTNINIIHAPGHTPGSTLFRIYYNLYTGDVLFYDSIGRIDFIGDNRDDMINTLKNIFLIKEKLIIFPGHGKNATLDEIKKTNHVLLEVIN